ncbi:glycosyltransferase involved in cell wall biosynthesis [Elusimicrobium simillimum]|uniref:glycosyltransferase family 4 protein n=1 Tax=Elusimicrobium simillimum TaxID=3143438 RepID=UPI003C6EABAA
MKIVIAIPTLAMGGAERLAVLQAREFAKNGHNVTILTAYNKPDFYTVPPEVNRVHLNLPHVHASFWHRARVAAYVAKTLLGILPDVLISHMMFNASLIGIILGIKTIFVEHLVLNTETLTFTKRFVLNKAHACVFLSERDRITFNRLKFKSRCEVIYNPAIKPELEEDVLPPFMKPSLNAVAVGRLVRQKGFDILINAWAEVAKTEPDWHLSIVGEGPQLSELQDIIQTANLESKVTLAGSYHNIAAVYKNADIFVLSSRSEGFPLALCEAMSWNVPPVAFDCETGPNVIIRDGEDGVLVTDLNADALARAIKDFIKNTPLRTQCAQATAEVTERFSLQKYIDAYEFLFKN